jgi:hypothetical protein
MLIDKGLLIGPPDAKSPPVTHFTRALCLVERFT